MATVEVLRGVREALEGDAEYVQMRRAFREDYEWLERYWKDCTGGWETFIKRYGAFYWDLDQIKVSARRFAEIECVGDSNRAGYEQNGEIAKATMHLRHHAGLFPDGESPSCKAARCREQKIAEGVCEAAHGSQWPEGSMGCFKALMAITRQVRHNLVHGNKYESVEDQGIRNRILVRIAAEVAGTIWRELDRAEQACGGCA